MSFGARLSIVCVSDFLVQLESARLLYVTGRHSRVRSSFGKRHAPFFQKRLLKFSDFSQNHDEICLMEKCNKVTFPNKNNAH